MGVTLKIVSTVVVIDVLFGHVLFKSGGVHSSPTSRRPDGP